MRLAVVLTVVAALAASAPAVAQSPSPRPTGVMGVRKIPVSNLSNPANRSTNPNVMGGQGCISGPTAVRSQTTAVNPITGQHQATTIVSIPLTKGGGVAGSTTRAQQAQACAHTR